MKTLTLSKRSTERKRLDETGNDFSRLITESTICYDVNGSPLIAYEELPAPLTSLSKGLQRIRYEKSGRTGGLPTISRVFGYQPRVTIRRDFCGPTSLNSEEPTVYSHIKDGAQVAAASYKNVHPTLYRQHKREADKLDPRWLLPGTPFTSGIINRNNQLRYHLDSGNIKEAWSAMFVFKNGTEGGYLSCPEFDIGFELKNNSLLLFDGQSILHGVTPIKLLTPKSFRISIVYYSLLGMWRCLPPSEELARIRKVKTEREARRAA